MSRRSICFCIGLLPVLALPALAAEWTAEIVEDEGGPRMMASVTGPGSGEAFPPEIFIFCGASGEVNLRYAFSVGEGELPFDGPVAFTFEFGSGSARLDMVFEEMDGAFAAYIPVDHEIVGLLRSAATVIVDNPTGLYHVQAFPLTGSSAALDTLLAACE